MKAVSDLLASAKLEAENLYRTWQVISMARLASDGEIEVRTRDGMRVIFGTREDYLRQIARLDLLVDDSKTRLGPCGRSTSRSARRCRSPTGRRPRPSPSRRSTPRRRARRRPIIAFPAFTSLHVDSHREL